MKLIWLGNSRSVHSVKPWLLGGAAGLLAIILESLPIVAHPVSQVATLPRQPAIIAQSPTMQQNANGLKVSAQASRSDRPTLKQGSQGETVSELQAALKLLGFYPGSVDGVYGEQTVQAVSRFQSAAGLEVDGIAGMDTWNRLFPPTPKISAPNLSANLTEATRPSAMPTASPELPPASVPVVQTTTPIVDTTSPSPLPSPRPVSPQPAKNRSTGGTATVSPSAQPSTQRGATSEKNAQVSLPVLKKGMRGPAVTHLQERLRSLGVFKGAIDGVFGAETETAVKAAQHNRGLSSDGVVGPMTWSVLLR